MTTFTCSAPAFLEINQSFYIWSDNCATYCHLSWTTWKKWIKFYIKTKSQVKIESKWYCSRSSNDGLYYCRRCPVVKGNIKLPWTF